MEELQSECNSKRLQTITRKMQYKIKNTAIKAKAIVTKHTHTHTQEIVCNKS